jgi:hypothetical protein
LLPRIVPNRIGSDHAGKFREAKDQMVQSSDESESDEREFDVGNNEDDEEEVVLVCQFHCQPQKP